MANRKLDVDLDDEDNFIEDEGFVFGSLAEQESLHSTKESQVKSLLSRNAGEALGVCLNNPPIGLGDMASLKERATALVVECLTAVKTNDIGSVVKSLSSAQIDTLFKYIYRAMAIPEYNAALLLTWHEKAFEIGGLGSVVRVLTDRRTV